MLANVRMVANRFVTEWLADAHEVVKLYALDGTFEREVALPAIGSIGGFSGKRSHTESFYSFSSFAYPGVVYHYDFATAKSTVFKQPTVDFTPDATSRPWRSSTRRRTARRSRCSSPTRRA